jgi:hypothetical protein
MDAVNHADLLQRSGMATKYCIAWAEKNPEAKKVIEVLLNSLSTYGVTCCVFTNVAEASQWLFFGLDTQEAD